MPDPWKEAVVARLAADRQRRKEAEADTRTTADLSREMSAAIRAKVANVTAAKARHRSLRRFGMNLTVPEGQPTYPCWSCNRTDARHHTAGAFWLCDDCVDR